MIQPQPSRLIKGLSLLEVLIAVIILSVGLLGIAALQANALKSNQSALQRSQAVMLANFILDAMRANRQAAIAGAYNTSSPLCITPSPGGSLVEHDRREWILALKNNLGDAPTTCGFIQCDSTGLCTIRITWDDSRAGGEANQSFEVSTQL